MNVTPLVSIVQAAAPAPSAGGELISFLMPVLPVLAIFYFLVFRPQAKRQREHQATIAAVKKGDEVITGGGLRGRVTRVSDDEVEVELAPQVKVRAVKSTLSNVVTRDTKPAND